MENQTKFDKKGEIRKSCTHCNGVGSYWLPDYDGILRDTKCQKCNGTGQSLEV